MLCCNIIIIFVFEIAEYFAYADCFVSGNMNSSSMLIYSTTDGLIFFISSLNLNILLFALSFSLFADIMSDCSPRIDEIWLLLGYQPDPLTSIVHDI